MLDGARRSLAGALRPALMLVNVGSGAKSRGVRAQIRDVEWVCDASAADRPL